MRRFISIIPAVLISALALPLLAEDAVTLPPRDEQAAEANSFMNARVLAVQKDQIQIRDNEGKKRTLAMDGEARIEGRLRAGADVILALKGRGASQRVVSVKQTTSGPAAGTSRPAVLARIPSSQAPPATFVPSTPSAAETQASWMFGGGGPGTTSATTGGSPAVVVGGNTPGVNTGVSPGVAPPPVTGTITGPGVPASNAPTGAAASSVPIGGPGVTNAPPAPSAIGTTLQPSANPPSPAGSTGGTNTNPIFVAPQTNASPSVQAAPGAIIGDAPASGGGANSGFQGGTSIGPGRGSATGTGTTGTGALIAGSSGTTTTATTGTSTTGFTPGVVLGGASGQGAATVVGSSPTGSTQVSTTNQTAGSTLGADAQPLPVGHAVRAYEAAVARAAARVAEVDRAFGQYSDACIGPRSVEGAGPRWLGVWDGSSARPETRDECEPLLANAVRLGEDVQQQLASAEDLGRRSGVLPGIMRQIRGQYGLDWSGWER
jgi:hypothetical protein